MGQFTMKDFMNLYVEKLLSHNTEYLELTDYQVRLLEIQNALSHLDIPSPMSKGPDTMEISLICAQIHTNAMALDHLQTILTSRSENSTRLKLYLYIDDVFIFKSDVFGPSSSPIIDLRVRVELTADCKEVRLDLYDA